MRDELELRRELPRAEHGLPPALASTRPAIEDVEVLALGVVGARFRRHLEMGLDDVIHVHEHRRRPLLALLLDHHRALVVQGALVQRLAQRVRAEGLRLRCAATSRATCELAGQLGIQIEELDAIGWLDLTLDGADEIDPDLNLIKGGGGAHLREKIIAAASDRMVVIADPTKVVEQLGAFHLPVEVLGFGVEATRIHIQRFP